MSESRGRRFRVIIGVGEDLGTGVSRSLHGRQSFGGGGQNLPSGGSLKLGDSVFGEARKLEKEILG